MKKNRIIIIALAAVTVFLLVSVVAAMPDLNKKDTKLKFKSKSPLTEGDSLKISLTDANKTPLANKTVFITIKDEDGNVKNHSVVTKKNGVAKLKLKNSPGEYLICLNFTGDDEYNQSSINKTFTIEEEVVEAQVESSDSNYDPGSFYSAQAGRVVYTGEVQEGPDGHTWKHMGYNEWVKVD